VTSNGRTLRRTQTMDGTVQPLLGNWAETPIYKFGAAICSFEERPMRIMTAIAMLALLIASHSVSAKDTSEPEAGSPKVSASKSYTAEESAAMGRAARTKAEAQEQIWDRKMKIITRGICTGC
jgi:hypothetical protein